MKLKKKGIVTMEKLDHITVDELQKEQKDIAELIGLDEYKKLVEHYGGTSIYIYNTETLLRCNRNAEIRKLFNGYNFKELALKFGLSERSIRMIIAQQD